MDESNFFINIGRAVAGDYSSSEVSTKSNYHLVSILYLLWSDFKAVNPISIPTPPNVALKDLCPADTVASVHPLPIMWYSISSLCVHLCSWMDIMSILYFTPDAVSSSSCPVLYKLLAWAKYQTRCYWNMTEASRYIYTLICPITRPAANHCAGTGLGHLRKIEYPNVHVFPFQPSCVFTFFITHMSTDSVILCSLCTYYLDWPERLCRQSVSNYFWKIRKSFSGISVFFRSWYSIPYWIWSTL